MRTHDLTPPILFSEGEDPRTRRGREVIPAHVIRHGWLNYASSRMIQWDLRGGDGYGQDARIPHLATARAGASTPGAADFCRPTYLRHFAVPFDVAGWAMVEANPSDPNAGFKVAVLHGSNTDMWLAQVLRGARVASLWQEDRNGAQIPDADGRSWAHPPFDWTPRTIYHVRISVRHGWIAVIVDDRPIIEHRPAKMASTGQVGFRLDKAVVHLGAWVVNER